MPTCSSAATPGPAGGEDAADGGGPQEGQRRPEQVQGQPAQDLHLPAPGPRRQDLTQGAD